ncbi:hypothetical protein [Saccharopolyspora pogona]|uniref:hypothetical protein n=1 Tax=Saccharopolyspora pogona TaxID=333966 RepID=UPI001685127B|nr:hypothetical protein [Saccharopolyspora pogona]
MHESAVNGLDSRSSVIGFSLPGDAPLFTAVIALLSLVPVALEVYRSRRTPEGR